MLIFSSLGSRSRVVTVSSPRRWHSSLYVERAIPGGSGIHGFGTAGVYKEEQQLIADASTRLD
jgi:hypothetical protein